MGQTHHNTHYREGYWDYRQPAIYLLTFTTIDRRPILGSLIGDCNNARVEPSEVGNIVLRQFERLSSICPNIRILAKQLMPDHFHGILYVTAPLEKHLGIYIRGFKQQCNKEYRQLVAVANRESLTPNSCVEQTKEVSKFDCSQQSLKTGIALFATDYYPSRLKGPGQLQIMFDYLRDNPRRLAVKRTRPGYFRIQRNVVIAGTTCDTIGNQRLLLAPHLKPVHVRRVWNQEQTRNYMNECIIAARQGAILISPFISETERAVRDEALKEHLPIIIVHHTSLPELYKPEPMFFDACTEGRILIIAPQGQQSSSSTITYAHCSALNQFAETIVLEKFSCK